MPASRVCCPTSRVIWDTAICPSAICPWAVYTSTKHARHVVAGAFGAAFAEWNRSDFVS